MVQSRHDPPPIQMIKNYFAHGTASVHINASVGEGTKIWHHTHIDEGAHVGEFCNIGQNCYIAGIVGRGCKIQNNVNIFKGVIIEDDVLIGPNTTFTNVKTPRAFISRKKEFGTTIVKQGATIGAGVTIVCGVTIGDYAMIGAGSVVTKNISDFILAYGNPAKVKGVVNKDGRVEVKKKF